MKNAFFSIIITLFLFQTSFSQNKFPSSGSVGINTLNPEAFLHIRGWSGSRGLYLNLNDIPNGSNSPSVIWDSRNGGADYLFVARQENNSLDFSRFIDTWSNQLRIMSFKGSNGFIGLGTSDPKHKLDVRSNNDNTHASFTGNFTGIQGIEIKRAGGDKIRLVTNYTNYGGGLESSSALRFSVNGKSIAQPDMYIKTNGNVGIGTSDPKNRLSVNGHIWAKEIKVQLTDGADWVFDDDYNLPPLSQVENYIKENKHLPEIPSATEFRENDMKVSEMMNKLLQKIEELTLYTIEQQKEIGDLKLEIQNLRE